MERPPETLALPQESAVSGRFRPEPLFCARTVFHVFHRTPENSRRDTGQNPYLR